MNTCHERRAPMVISGQTWCIQVLLNMREWKISYHLFISMSIFRMLPVWLRTALRSSESTKMRPTPRATSQMRTLTYADLRRILRFAIVLSSSCVLGHPYQQRFGIIPCECTLRKHFLIVCRSRVPDFSQISSFSLAYILYVSVQVDSSTMWKILTAI
jgi:hypothetical protein